MQLVDFIAEYCLWGSKQYITLWRDLENYSMEIKSDENLLDWFLLNVEKGFVCINAQVNDFDGPLQSSPTKRRFHPSVRPSVLQIEEGTSERATNETATTERASNETTIATCKKRAATKKRSEEGEEVQSDSSYDTNLAASSDSGDDSSSDTEFDPDGEIVDEEDVA
ncbi:hypothetical protein C2845_PMPSC049106 [Panicum miliaceum]|uniref:Uncharacterized protein n=1 Tax=Panicum miliaceum TaxID=4540 RepID=A0A3L6PCP7_PANMI|nr:hypothetical protein C2845_PMPSC049106 [Panicum miliaceum]